MTATRERKISTQTLIIVADFDDRSEGKHQGIDPAQYIYEKLDERVETARTSLNKIEATFVHRFIEMKHGYE